MADFNYEETTPNGTVLTTLVPSGGVGYTYAIHTDEILTSQAIAVEADGDIVVADNTKLTGDTMNFVGLVKETATCQEDSISITGEKQTVGPSYAYGYVWGTSPDDRTDEWNAFDWSEADAAVSADLFKESASLSSNQATIGFNTGPNHMSIGIIYVRVTGGSYTQVNFVMDSHNFIPISAASEYYMVASNNAPLTGSSTRGWTVVRDMGLPVGGLTNIFSITDIGDHVDVSQDVFIAVTPKEYHDNAGYTDNYDDNWFKFDSVSTS